MALTNCTINSQSFTKTSGNAIGSANAQLVITPDTGYTVSASNFTNNTGAISGIISITLSDSDTPGAIDNTVLVDVDLDDSYIMPSSNIDLVIDIDGAADIINYTISGTYNTVTENTAQLPESGSYSQSGLYDTQVTVLTKTFTADAGYYFVKTPTYILNAANKDRYTITYVNTTDSENRIVSTVFTIKYTFSNESQIGDSISFTAKAIQYYVPVVEITSYSIVTSNVSPLGDTRIMTIYGTEGATFSLTVYNEDPTEIKSITNQAIPANGQYTTYISFPEVTDDDQYDFTLTGDLAASFDTTGQPSTFSILQKVANTAPVSSNITPASISQLGISSFALSATDADGDPVYYYLVGLPINGTIHTSVTDAQFGANPILVPGPVSTPNLYYKHTVSGSYSDTLAYKATDNIAYGNISSVNFTIS